MKFLISLFILVLPLACSNNTTESESLDGFIGGEYDMELSKVDVREEVKSSANDDIEQKLIKEAYLHFETDDLEKTYTSINKIVSKYQGYIQNDRSNKGYNQISRQVNIRIPSKSFQAAIHDISSIVKHFDTKQVSSRDVSEEFVDLNARLKAKKTLEERYLELLKKANNVKEILEIERELSSIREEIEAKEGRLKYLQNQVSLSSINLEFYTLTTETKVAKSYGSKMWNAIVSGFDGLSAFFLGILYIWPLILILVTAFFFMKRWLSKRSKS